jgi:hypothetical protein
VLRETGLESRRKRELLEWCVIDERTKSSLCKQIAAVLYVYLLHPPLSALATVTSTTSLRRWPERISFGIMNRPPLPSSLRLNITHLPICLPIPQLSLRRDFQAPFCMSTLTHPCTMWGMDTKLPRPKSRGRCNFGSRDFWIG